MNRKNPKHIGGHGVPIIKAPVERIESDIGAALQALTRARARVLGLCQHLGAQPHPALVNFTTRAKEAEFWCGEVGGALIEFAQRKGASPDA